MKKFKVIKNGIETNGWTSDSGLDEKHYEPSFGKPERWVTQEQEDVTQAIETREVEITPAILAEPGQILTPEVLDDEGNVITAAVIADGTEVITPAVMVTEYKLAAEYTIEIEDITEELEREKTNQEAREYLAHTDWYIIRELDNGTPCPPEIKTARAEARLKVIN